MHGTRRRRSESIRADERTFLSRIPFPSSGWYHVPVIGVAANHAVVPLPCNEGQTSDMRVADKARNRIFGAEEGSSAENYGADSTHFSVINPCSFFRIDLYLASFVLAFAFSTVTAVEA